MQESVKILIVEDERIPATYLKSIIEEDENFEVVGIAPSAKEALKLIKRYKPQVIFMDVMIKGQMSGAELALKIRTLYDNIKIIFMTAYSDEEMLEYAAESQAFAYLLKPYRPKQIKATLTLLKSKLKREEPVINKSSKLYLKGGYIYDLETDILSKNGKHIQLSPKETKLLGILCKNPKQMLSKEAISEIMGISATSLRAHIYRLRKNLNEKIIVSSKKFGYKIELEDINAF